MSGPSTYSWLIAPTSMTGGLPPNPGTPVSGSPSFRDARRDQFARGIKFANVPNGRADFVVHGGARVHHVNSVTNILQETIDKFDFSGVVVFSRKDKKLVRLPDSVRGFDPRSVDRFMNPVFPFTGRYPDGFDLFTIDDGIWIDNAEMNDGRSDYVGAEMLDKTVIVVGGLDASLSPISSVESFDTGSVSWTLLTSLPTAKAKAAGAVLENGDLLVLGGSGTTPNEATASYRYLTGSDAWSTITVDLIVSRKDFSVIKLTDGRVFAPGGTGLSASIPFTGSEIFEPADDTWHSDPDTAPAIPLYPYDREGYTLTLLDDGSVLLLGGKDPRNDQPYPHTLRFFPNDQMVSGSTASWSVEHSMSFSRYKHSAVKLDDGRVLVAGGEGGSQENLQAQFPFQLGAQFGSSASIAEVEIYDPTDGNWSHVGQMKNKRSRFGMHLIPGDGGEGRILVVGGRNGSTVMSSSEVNEVEFGAWKNVSPLGVAVKDMGIFQISFPADQPSYNFIVPSGRRTPTSVHTSSQKYNTNG